MPIKLFVAFVFSTSVFVIGCTQRNSDVQPDNAHEDLHGKWYVQQIYGQANDLGLIIDDRPTITMDRDGRFVMSDISNEEVVARYTINTADQTLRFERDGDFAVFRYAIVDDVLLLRPDQGNGPTEEAEMLAVIELTLVPDGNSRHQAIRDLLSGQPLPSEVKRSDENLRVLIDAVLAAKQQKGSWPAGLGHLALNGAFEIDRLFAPWAPVALPDQFDRLKPEQQQRWLGGYSSYVYLHDEMYGDDLPREGGGPHLVLFELHRAEQADHIGLAFSDGKTQRVSREEASKILQQHTGNTLSDWIMIYD